LGVLLALVLAAPAGARKPVVSYVDATTHVLRFYDAESGTEVPAPALTIPGLRPGFAVSFDGRYIAYVDAASKIHLYDRAVDGELPLPGIDVYATPGHKPAGLSVSDTGRIAFDENSHGLAVVYDSAARAFVASGLPPTNGHRQSHLSADGRFLATTCVLGTNKCVVDDNARSDSDAFVQDLATRLNTAFPNNLAPGESTTPKDEEHPCINGDGSLVAVDVNVGGGNLHDIFMYDRRAGAAVPLPGVNVLAVDQVNCVLSAVGGYLGYDDNAGHFKLYERSTQAIANLPASLVNPIWFSAPYTKPPPAPPGPVADRTAPKLTAASVRPATFAVDPNGASERAVSSRARRGTTFRYRVSERSRVVFTVASVGKGRRVGRRCVRQTLLNRRRRSCARYARVGRFAQSARAGANTKRFSGKIARKKLKPGRYRVTLVATDAAKNTSTPRSIFIRVVTR